MFVCSQELNEERENKGEVGRKELRDAEPLSFI